MFLLYSHYNINIPTKVFDILSGRHELCNGQIYEFLIKIRSAFYQCNIDIDSTPRIYEFFTTSYNSKGKKLEINFEYIKYCLKNIYDDNLITRNPAFSSLFITCKHSSKKKNRILSDFKLKFLCQISIKDLKNEHLITSHPEGYSFDLK